MIPFPTMQTLPHHIRTITTNQIVAIANMARTDPNVIKLWVGEPDLATPEFIIEATVDAMRTGETRYTYSRGLPAIHDALARYHKRHWQVGPKPPVVPSRIAV